MSKTAEECNNWLDQILHEKHREHQFDMMNSALGQARIEGAEAMHEKWTNWMLARGSSIVAPKEYPNPKEVVKRMEKE